MATSVYKDYFPTFLSTAINLFPNDERTIIVISDGLSYFDGKTYNDIKIVVHSIIDMPYPMLPSCKFRFVTSLTKDHHFDYILFVDSDTIIFKRKDEFWESLKKLMDDGHLLLSRHPHYLYNEHIQLNDVFIIKNEKSCAYMEEDYINQNKSYIITSFFAGKQEVIERYDKKIYEMIGRDLYNMRWMPEYVDEAYMNYIYVQESILSNESTIHLDTYITINPYTFPGALLNLSNDDKYSNNFLSKETIFMNQKFDISIKNRKKNNTV